LVVVVLAKWTATGRKVKILFLMLQLLAHTLVVLLQ
jgi:hypothetical protein